MLSRFLPERLDNDHRGHPIALWLFYPITLLTLVRIGLHILRKPRVHGPQGVDAGTVAS